MTEAVVFLGPSLDAPGAMEIFQARYLPPAKLGSIYHAVKNLNPDVVVLIDGHFHDVLSVWHREILWAITKGVHVFGAASMGALRAAELEPFGMRGVGKIFESYRGGQYDPYPEPFEDDDEVAIVHGPPETGYLQLSDAMVDIREALARAARDGAISKQMRDRAVSWAKRKHFPERNMAAVRHAVRGWELASADRLEAWLAANKTSQKLEDATALLHVVRDFAEKYPGPCCAPFTFERVLVWERARAKLDRQIFEDAPE